MWPVSPSPRGVKRNRPSYPNEAAKCNELVPGRVMVVMGRPHKDGGIGAKWQRDPAGSRVCRPWSYGFGEAARHAVPCVAKRAWSLPARQ